MSLTKCDNCGNEFQKMKLTTTNYIVFSQFNKKSLKISYLVKYVIVLID